MSWEVDFGVSLSLNLLAICKKWRKEGRRSSLLWIDAASSFPCQLPLFLCNPNTIFQPQISIILNVRYSTPKDNHFHRSAHQHSMILFFLFFQYISIRIRFGCYIHKIRMDMKLLLLLLACLFLQATQLSLARHDGNYDTCFYSSIGNIYQNNDFNYTITQAWTAEQAAQLKSGALNTSDFIRVNGWEAYSTPSQFFTLAGSKGKFIERKLKPIKNVTSIFDAPQFGFATNADLELAFGTPSQAKLYKVPSGKAVLAVRFQAAVAGSPFIGKWSVLVDLVEDDEIGRAMKIHSAKLRQLVKSTHLTPKNVTSSLNIIPPFIENSIFWTLPTSPAQGTTAPIVYTGFLVVIRAGQEFLAGPIADGQPNIVQVKDVVSPRTECVQ